VKDKAGDVEGTKQVRRALNKRGIDASRADVRVMHGVAYIRGQVQAIKGHDIPDLRTEMEQIARFLRQRAEIRDVVLDVTYKV
jgi:hypothetical protein